MQVPPPRRSSRPSLILTLLGLIVALTAASPAVSEPLQFEATAVKIVNLIGSLNVVVSDNPNLTVDITGPSAAVDDIGVRLDGTTLIVSRRGMVDATGHQFDASTYPTVVLTVPANTPLTIIGMDGQASIGDIAAPLVVRVASVDLTAGNVMSAIIDRSGGGRIQIGNIEQSLVARLSGSGDFVVGTAGQADIEKRGSGNISLDRVDGALRALVQGSGDINIADAGAVNVEKHGSGDITVGRVTNGLSYLSFGIGDVDVAAVNGPVVVETTSSGQVHIHDGRADPLRVVMHEYGNFTLDGEAVDPDLTAEGASVVKITSYIGELIARGTGTFDVRKRSLSGL